MKFNDDGTTDTVEIPSTTMNDLLSFTVTFWVNTVNFSADPCYFSVASSNSVTELLIGQKLVHLKNGVAVKSDFDFTAFTTSTNNWIHVAVVRDVRDGRIQVYTDGTLYQEDTGYDTGALIADRIFFGNRQGSIGGGFANTN